MLLSFTCSNFRSIKDEQTISFVAGPTKNLDWHSVDDCSIKVLKGTMIFGNNGAGKSSIYKAIRYSRDIIIKQKPEYVTDNYFALDDSYKDKPSVFEYEISVDDGIYRYGFETTLKDTKIKSEYLKKLYPEEKIVFIRNENGEVDYGGQQLIIEKVIGDLFIHVAKCDWCKNEQNDIWKVYNWFYKSLAVLGPDKSLLWDYFTDDKSLSEKENEKKLDDEFEKVTKLMAHFDTGITGWDFIPHNIETDEPIERVDNSRQVYNQTIVKFNDAIIKVDKNGVNKAFRFKHENGRFIKLNNESDGTLRILKMMPILTRDDKDCTYIIDEFDRALHPLVVREFISLFLKKNFEHKKQLIITTHNTLLLDQDLMRRDEIWFIDKRKDGSSEVYSLDDYKERFDKKILNAYLEGRYKGIPDIRTGDFDEY